MKTITITKSAGFCFGVRRALQLAEQTASANKKVYMLGEIVHNPRVVSDIKKTGVIKINELRPQHKGILLIRAHGAPRETYKKAKKLGYTIIDATCPMVKEIHSIAREYEQKKFKIIIIGDKKHDEVIGIKGNLENEPIIIAKKKEITPKTFYRVSKAAVVVQSTQNIDKVLDIVEKLEKHIKKVVFCNTICLPTRLKQQEIQELPATQDMMIIIGAKSSANTKRLYELSKKINPNTYWVNSKTDIRKSWFKNKEKIGIGAGASTPEYIIKEIASYIRSI
ncbi:MAG: 4-hydroxy-3-methylbut-2-enyl diphosphate reductase [Candidatus Omnitrophica bacterium]|nr:4-hydroxy-3-methylbut-2-enyl diphosphate reductase [Candidatus Omnitrophota bacterium]